MRAFLFRVEFHMLVTDFLNPVAAFCCAPARVTMASPGRALRTISEK
jgi:hypothetical protein